MKPLKASIFNDTYGLLVTAAFFGVCVWLGMVLVNHGIPQVVAYRWTFHIIGGGSIASAFFTMVAVSLFGNSGMKNEFCSIFDPGADYNTLPCGFSDGFNYVRWEGAVGLPHLCHFPRYCPPTTRPALPPFRPSRGSSSHCC